MQTITETSTQSHSQNDQPEESSTGVNMLERSDALLQLSRRIDWRFLLPSPVLGNVAFRGPAESEHFRALQELGESVELIDPQTPTTATFEVFVIHAGHTEMLECARQHLQRGGHVYWEIDRKKMFARGRRTKAFRHFEHFVEILKKKGFGDIEVYWHRPNFQSCLEIIPLDDRPEASGLAAAFSKRGGNFKKRLKFRVGRFLWKSGLLHRVAPCISIIAQKN